MEPIVSLLRQHCSEINILGAKVALLLGDLKRVYEAGVNKV